MTNLKTLAADMTRMATSFLDSLRDEQRRKATVPFEDEKTRREWYYTPTPRAGLPIVEMTPEQHQRVRLLLASGLSEAGYNYVASIMSQEYMVDFIQGFPDRPYGELPNTRMRDPGNYCVAVFGTPGDADAWGWSIGGHHLSLHYTLRDGLLSPTPAFFGAEPSRARMPGGVTLRPLAAEEDLARELLLQLSPDQREQAVLAPIAPTDVVQTNRPRVEDGALPVIGGPGPGGQVLRDELKLTPELDEMVRYSLQPKGLAAKEMHGGQRDQFVRLVQSYFDHMPEAIWSQYTALLEPQHLDSTAFAWAGPAEPGAPHYYRIQSDRLLIEYDCTQDHANHTHTVWRDPQGDFGDEILARHLAGEQRR